MYTIKDINDAFDNEEFDNGIQLLQMSEFQKLTKTTVTNIQSSMIELTASSSRSSNP